MLRRVGEAEPLPERYLPVFLGVLAVLFTIVPLIFVSLVFFGTHPGAIPGLRSAEKKLAPDLEQNIGALPAGFHAETNIMVAGGVGISARGQGTVAQGTDTHRVLLNAIDRTDTGNINVRFKSGSETAEAQWKEKWPHGEVKVFKV